MKARDRSSSRWKTPHLESPTKRESHLTEPEQEIRRIQQCRLLVDLTPSDTVRDTAVSTWAREGAARVEFGDLLGAMQCFQSALQNDADCYEAWLGLSVIFQELSDPARAGRCRGVARSLRSRCYSQPAMA